jgi:ABC-type polysaccharide/polyol phosphate export permease
VADVLNPVRHYIEIVRAVFLKGVGFELWAQYLALLLIGASLLTFAALRASAGSRRAETPGGRYLW